MVYYVATQNALATYYGSTLIKYLGALTALGTAGAIGTEVNGGAPAYARLAGGWGTATAGAITSAADALNIPSGATVVGVSGYDVVSGVPTYYDQVSITSQAFASQGTLTVTATFTET